METFDIARALVPRPDQERVVRRRFWSKVKASLGRVPFLDRALAAYFAAMDPLTPAHAKATLFAALAYFVLPADLIPDFIAGIGFTDDGAVLLMAVQALAPHIREHHVERARHTLHTADIEPTAAD